MALLISSTCCVVFFASMCSTSFAQPTADTTSAEKVTLQELTEDMLEIHKHINKLSATVQQQETKIRFMENVIFSKVKDCSELWAIGVKKDGVYDITLQGNGISKIIQVYCEFTDKEGFTRVQRRQDGSVNFNQNWSDYKSGFGDVKEEHWLGNDNIQTLTSQKSYTLRIDLLLWNGTSYYAEYNTFKVGDEGGEYELHIAGYSGNAGDCMWQSSISRWQLDGIKFSTKDNENDLSPSYHCGKKYQGGWWFNNCFCAHLNGVYWSGGTCKASDKYICMQWSGIGWHAPIKTTSMKLKDPTIRKPATL